MKTIAAQLQKIRQQISDAERRFERSPGSAQLLAVSKTKPIDAIRAAIAEGQHSFGENYLQEAVEKIETLHNPALDWHFIGAIQSNKTATIAANFNWVHTVDRLKIARRLSEQRPESLPPLNICLQVNTSGEQSKSGITFDELEDLAKEVVALPGVSLRGLMTIPAPEDDFERQRLPFRQLRLALERLNQQGHQLDTLSMGMSSDLEAAIAEGATYVRIGSAIFGARN
ncbi:YggS family pyridoxal phosphate enzyme [Solemya pervernicosa gill symbiont]|uniref:Pyridoxal phosphate homeostasis protein n=2 Tax=Gammaproteobacteria incertae sedis TaxID=118884 RepID=A0A1T2LA62_9GAMM|nr:YggS family pyridoxal phosphate-dependent enzyme [Candidatus Reidiella endopervernicosa]OOZ41934.1 YggS family pyridoxal phosphate enzyme [Solemya pervernicosa gill symbiont]QKQ24900.1 YggS family pyridoxal phosphate-dependent enzyme [Candidatus Reidiella endopervernicosa]